jgi:hypothetical protein
MVSRGVYMKLLACDVEGTIFAARYNVTTLILFDVISHIK